MSGQDLYLSMQNTVNLLNAALKQYGDRGRAWATAEREYRVSLAKKIIEERDKGTPVTVVQDVCRGSAEIAELKFKRDCAEVVYKSAQEAINTYKLQIKVLENQIDREWKG